MNLLINIGFDPPLQVSVSPPHGKLMRISSETQAIAFSFDTSLFLSSGLVTHWPVSASLQVRQSNHYITSDNRATELSTHFKSTSEAL